MRVTFFNQPWRRNQFHEGMDVLFFGKVDLFRGTKSMSNPDVDLIGEPELGIRPIYPQSDKANLHSREFQKWIGNALDRAREFEDPVPMEILDRFDFVDRTAAFNGIHRPQSMHEGDVVARRRLKFDELLRIQLALVLRKKAIERSAKGFTHD